MVSYPLSGHLRTTFTRRQTVSCTVSHSRILQQLQVEISGIAASHAESVNAAADELGALQKRQLRRQRRNHAADAPAATPSFAYHAKQAAALEAAKQHVEAAKPRAEVAPDPAMDPAEALLREQWKKQQGPAQRSLGDPHATDESVATNHGKT